MAERSLSSALVGLALATGLIAVLSDGMVAQLATMKKTFAVTDLFLGVVVIIAIIGNAAEHASAVLMARRDRMELAISIAAGSAAQVALLVAPFWSSHPGLWVRSWNCFLVL